MRAKSIDRSAIRPVPLTFGLVHAHCVEGAISKVMVSLAPSHVRLTSRRGILIFSHMNRCHEESLM